MNILFLNPKPIFNTWPLPTDLSRFMLGFPSVTFPQLAATLRPGDTYEIFDGAFERCSREHYLRVLSGRDLVAISFHSAKIALNTLIAMRLVRALSPRAKIVLGGHHATAFHRRWVERGADVVVRREGEETFPAYLEALRQGREPAGIAGLTWRRDGEVVENPERPFLEDLDRLPFPDWRGMKLPNYRLRIARRGLTASVETARGCPYACNFCSASAMWNHRQRRKSVERVLEEMARLHILGVRQIALVDDNFGLHYERDMALVEGILQRLPGLSWWAFMRADTAIRHPDLVALAARSGLRQTIIGYESFSEGRLDEMGKGYRGGNGAGAYEQAYEVYRRNGIFVIGEFIIGIPGESAEERRELISRAESICDCVTINPFDYIHGTRAGAEFLQRLNLPEESLFHNIRGFPEAPDSQEKEIARAYSAYFLSSRTWRKIFSSDEVTSVYMRNLYWTVISNTARLTPAKIRNWFLARRKGLATPEKKRIIERYYLGRRYLNRLLRGSGATVTGEEREEAAASARANHPNEPGFRLSPE